MITLDTINALILDKENIDLSFIKGRKVTDHIGMLRRVFVYLVLKHSQRLRPQIPKFLNLPDRSIYYYIDSLNKIQEPLNAGYRILAFECSLILAQHYISDKAVLTRLAEMERELDELLSK